MGRTYPGGAYLQNGRLINANGEPLTSDQQAEHEEWLEQHHADMQTRIREDQRLQAEAFRNANPILVQQAEAAKTARAGGDDFTSMNADDFLSAVDEGRISREDALTLERGRATPRKTVLAALEE